MPEPWETCTQITSEAIRKTIAAIDPLKSRPPEYYLSRVNQYVQLLFNRFCPYALGDRIQLARTPIINEKEAWGWMGSKHFLIAGATGVVARRDADANGFSFHIEFDDESWIDDRDGTVHPASEKHAYCFRESDLKPLSL